MRCVICELDKVEEEFAWENKKKGKKHRRCKQCQRSLSKRHFQKNKEQYRQATKINRGKGRDHLDKYLKGHPCVDCGETDIEVLDFDHKEDKRIAVSQACCYSDETLTKEITKCEIRCGNCHRKRTSKQQWYSYRSIQKEENQTSHKRRRTLLREYVLKYLQSHPCQDCGEDDIVVLEFDHRPNENKKHGISMMVERAFSLDTLQKEIAKCDICCVNCHRKRTYNKRHGVGRPIG